MGTIGNTFDKQGVKYGHARKVWREIRHRYPAGGKLLDVDKWVGLGKVPAGTPVRFDMAKNEIQAYTDEEIKASTLAPDTGQTESEALSINGYLQEDIRIIDKDTVGTGTVVYAGEIYEYMFDQEVVAKLKTLTTVPGIVWVQ